VEKQYAQ